MSRRVWAVAVSVVVFGVLLSVALMAQEQPGPTEQKGGEGPFVELRLAMVKSSGAVAGGEALQALVLPAVQVVPGRQEVQEDWHGQRFGKDLNVRMSCYPSVRADGRILLEALHINSSADSPRSGFTLETSVSVKPGDTVLLGGTVATQGETPEAAEGSEMWKLSVKWPVEAPKQG